jgi:mannosyltransferase
VGVVWESVRKCIKRAQIRVMPAAPVNALKGEEDVRFRIDPSTEGRVELWPAQGRGSRQPIAWAWISAIVVVATVLRAIALNQQLWFDEIIMLLDSARESVWQTVTKYDWQNQHMLYSLLAHGSIRVFGEHPWALRLPAMLFGIASIPVLYAFARLVTTNREALLASGLMALNYQHIWFSQNARGYTGMAFWTLAASILFIRSASAGKVRDWMLYGIVAALGVYTHLTMAFVVIGHAFVYIWLVAVRAKALNRLPRIFFQPAYGIVSSGIISALLYAPVIPRIFVRTIGVAGKSVRTDWASPIWAFWELVHGLRAGTLGGVAAILVGGLVLLTGVLSYWRQNRFVVGLIALPAFVTGAAVLATSHNLWPRFFFFEIGFGLLLLVRGGMVWGKASAKLFVATPEFGTKLGTAIVALMMLASIPALRAVYRPKQDYLGAIQFVESQAKAGDPIVAAGDLSTPFQRYYGRPWPILETGTQLDAILDQGHLTWFVYSMPINLRAIYPDIWNAVQSRFETVRVFSGTLAGGDIYVSRSIASDVIGSAAQ